MGLPQQWTAPLVANILIIGINYRPETTGIAPYTSDLAEHLAAGGHRVTVITGFAHYPAWRLEPGERRLRAVESRDGVRVLRRRHYVPRSQSAIRRAAYEATFLIHGALSRPERPDVVFGVIPSLSGGLLARFFAARARAPYSLIFQDLMAPAARQSGIGGGARVAGATAALERWATARARTVAIASDSFRPYLQEIGVEEHRIFDLPNWSHLGAPTADRAATRDRLGWPADYSVVLHAGNMGLKQGLEQVVEAARRADALAAPVMFVLMGEGSQRTTLEAKARGIKRLRFLPFQPEDEVPNVLDAADVFLVSERATVIDMSLPSKLTSYFAAGRPIVAAVPPEGSTAREILQAGAGVIVSIGDVEELNGVVASLKEDPEWAGRLGAAGRRYAESALDLTSARTRIDRLLEQTLGGKGQGSAADRPAPSPDWFEVLGVRINAAPFATVLERVLQAPESGERLALHFATAHTLVESQDNEVLRDALREGLVQPDGMPLVWLGRAAGRHVERVCGPDFMPALIEHGIAAGRTHFFYGGAPGVPEALAARLLDRYPELRVAGTFSPPFRPLSAEEEESIVAVINAAAPDYVWVGLGTPKQDLWLAANRSRLGASALLAVGAAFDLFAGRRRRAPRWMQRTGTEWIYRLAMEPRRLASRYTRVNARFLRLLVEDHFKRTART
jgi:colanic acid biosynthesis glycosyl transferase WcaI